MTINTPQHLLNLKKYRKTGPKDKSRNPNPKTPKMMGEEKKTRFKERLTEMDIKKLQEMINKKKGGLSEGQKKIAAKAPPTNKIDGKDFAVLRAEKAKDRGMGLQDEKVKPGKVMKAKRGKFLKPDPTKPISSVQPSTTLPKDFVGKRKALARAKSALGMLKGPAKAGAILGAALTVPVGKMLKKIQDKRKAKNRDEAKVKKMGGGMMQKPMSYMGGGMMKPMGYKAGKSVKVKCKLGKNKPTKMY